MNERCPTCRVIYNVDDNSDVCPHRPLHPEYCPQLSVLGELRMLGRLVRYIATGRVR